MRVMIPDALRAYTNGCDRVEAQGQTLNDLLLDLDRQFPGIRFRMVNEQDQVRRHVVLFVSGERTDDLTTSLSGCHEVVILQALSGG